MRIQLVSLACFVLMVSVLVLADHAKAVDYHTERLTSDLHIPIAAVMAPGINDKIFIAQLGGAASDSSDSDPITSAEGRIVIYDRNTGQVDFDNPFLTINDTSVTDVFIPEVGLFSLAFHPDFQANGKFYVNVAVEHEGPPPIVDNAGPGGSPRVSPFKTVVREYTVDVGDPGLPVTGSRSILELDQPVFNHNGSWIGFSPAETAQGKNYLYITQGDGGDQHDPANYGQDPDSLYGTILRVDIDDDDFGDAERNYAIPADNPFASGGGAPEVWAYGLRNPWRASFDRLTSDLWIGDVGQGRFEEINFQSAASPGGENYGWRLREGLHETPTGGVGGPAPADNVDPVYEYAHGNNEFEGNSLTGGYLYRGPIAELQGQYLFADNVSGHIWSLDPNDPFGSVVNLDATVNPNGNIFAISSFGEDEDGNLLIVDGAGSLFQLVPGARSDLDANGQINIADWTQFIQHHLADLSGLPGSEKYSRGDLDLDGDNDYDDFVLFEMDYDAVHGLGALSAALSVPEPSSALMALFGLLASVTGLRLRR